MDGWIDGLMDGCVDGWMDGWMDDDTCRAMVVVQKIVHLSDPHVVVHLHTYRLHKMTRRLKSILTFSLGMI